MEPEVIKWKLTGIVVIIALSLQLCQLFIELYFCDSSLLGEKLYDWMEWQINIWEGLEFMELWLSITYRCSKIWEAL